MLRKRLLTLACVAGILAFGACFLPPLPPSPHREPPPSPYANLQGIHSIGVDVTNSSESHHVDPTVLARAVVENINWRASANGVYAHVKNVVSGEEGLLEIEVLSENALSSSPSAVVGMVTRNFKVEMSATLKSNDGKVLWHAARASYPVSQDFPVDYSADPWNESLSQRRLADALSNALVYRMLYVAD
jgi:hypothetical protein